MPKIYVYDNIPGGTKWMCQCWASATHLLPNRAHCHQPNRLPPTKNVGLPTCAVLGTLRYVKQISKHPTQSLVREPLALKTVVGEVEVL